MAVLGRILIGSAERLDLPDLLSIDSFITSDFRAIIDSFVGGTTPYILRGLEVLQPNSAIGTQNVSIGIADAVVYYPSSKAGPFFKGLEEGNIYAAPIIPELKKNAINYVYAGFTAFDTTRDSRAFWDPDQDGGRGGEFTQDVNTESVLGIQLGVSVASFPEGTIPICKVTVGSSVITAIQDCRNLMFRLGTGGAAPNPLNTYGFRNLPSAEFARKEAPGTMTTVADPNCFRGGDKNITTLKDWMDVAMTKMKELGGTTFWYEALGSNAITLKDLFWYTTTSQLKSKGEWRHDSVIPGHLEWTEDLKVYSLVDGRITYMRGGSIVLPDDHVAYVQFLKDADINVSVTPVTWQIGYNALNGPISSFENLRKGDWVKKNTDDDSFYLRVEEFYAGSNMTGGVTTPELARSVKLSDAYSGASEQALSVFTRGEYNPLDVQITPRTSSDMVAVGGQLYWLATRNDTVLNLNGITTVELNIDITDADGVRARATETVLANHGLRDGDRITITSGAFVGTHVVNVESDTTFFINTDVVASESGVEALYAIVEVGSVSTPDGFLLESERHCFQSGNRVFIEGTPGHDGGYLLNERAGSTFQIPVDSVIADPGAGVVRMARISVRTEFGSIKILQGTSGNIGDIDTLNILRYLGMPSLSVTHPTYDVPSNYNALDGFSNFNCAVDDNITVRAAKLTAMMADRVQDRHIQIIGRTNIWNRVNGLDQEIHFEKNLIIIKHGSPSQELDLSLPFTLPENTAIVFTIDRDGGSIITPQVESLGSPFLIEENKFILAYRFTSGTVYLWDGSYLEQNGRSNTNRAEDSQNRNVFMVNYGNALIDPDTDLVTLKMFDRNEVSKVVAVDGATIIPNAYFVIHSAYDVNAYYVWFDVDGTGIDPLVGGMNAIPVSILSTYSAEDVAAAIAAAVDLEADFTGTAISNEVTISNTAFGATTSIYHGPVQSGVAISVIMKGAEPDILIEIPGAQENTIDVSAINALGTLVIPDGYSAWVRINRFAAKTFNTVETTDVEDSDIAGAIYITTIESVPTDQDVFVLWSNVDGQFLQTHSVSVQDDNIYEEWLTLVAGAPANAYEIQGNIPAGSVIQLPPDSLDGGRPQVYMVGGNMLEMNLNGQELKRGEDWEEVGVWSQASRHIRILQDLIVDDKLRFRIDGKGAVYFAISEAAALNYNLQDAYDSGFSITIEPGKPVSIYGPAGMKLLAVHGDMYVEGVIDPKGITFTPSTIDPLGINDFGFWRNDSDEMILKRGLLSPINFAAVFENPLTTDYDIYTWYNGGPLRLPKGPDNTVLTSTPSGLEWMTTGSFASMTWADIIDFAGSDLAHLETRKHSDLTEIGVHTHGQIDTHITNTYAHGTSSNVVGVSDWQTISNKWHLGLKLTGGTPPPVDPEHPLTRYSAYIWSDEIIPGHPELPVDHLYMRAGSIGMVIQDIDAHNMIFVKTGSEIDFGYDGSSDDRMRFRFALPIAQSLSLSDTESFVMIGNASAVDHNPALLFNASGVMGAMIVAATEDGADADLTIRALENDNTDFATLTTNLLVVKRFNSNLMTLKRNGQLDLWGNFLLHGQLDLYGPFNVRGDGTNVGFNISATNKMTVGQSTFGGVGDHKVQGGLEVSVNAGISAPNSQLQLTYTGANPTASIFFTTTEDGSFKIGTANKGNQVLSWDGEHLYTWGRHHTSVTSDTMYRIRSMQNNSNLSNAGLETLQYVTSGRSIQNIMQAGSQYWTYGIRASDGVYVLISAASIGSSEGFFEFSPAGAAKIGTDKTTNTHVFKGANIEHLANVNGTPGLYHINESVGASAGALISARTDGSGDAWYRVSIGTTRSWSMGIDNSDSDKWKLTTIGAGTANPSAGTEAIVADDTGAVYLGPTAGAATPRSYVNTALQITLGAQANHVPVAGSIVFGSYGVSIEPVMHSRVDTNNVWGMRINVDHRGTTNGQRLGLIINAHNNGSAVHADDYLVSVRNNNADYLHVRGNGRINISTLTASYLVATDANKNLVSLQYTTTNTASAIVQRDGSGNINIQGANVAGLTASYLVATDASKNLVSLQYATTNTANAVVQRDGSGNFQTNNIRVIGLSASQLVATDSNKDLTSLTYDTEATNNAMVRRTSTGGIKATTGEFSGKVSAGADATMHEFTGFVRIKRSAVIGEISTDMDCSAQHIFRKILVSGSPANTVFTISNMEEGQTVTFSVKNYTGKTYSWGTTIKWMGGSAPNTGYVNNTFDLYSFIKINGEIYGSYIPAMG